LLFEIIVILNCLPLVDKHLILKGSLLYRLTPV